MDGLAIDASRDTESGELLRLHSQAVLPLEPIVYRTDITPKERKSGIEELALALDELEGEYS